MSDDVKRALEWYEDYEKGIVIRRGTKIVCPLCKRVIGEFIKDVKEEDTLNAKNIRIYGREVKNGEPMTCPYCGFPYCMDSVIGSFIHTEKGWMPPLFPDHFIMTSIMEFLTRKKMWEKEWDKYLKETKKSS